MQAMMTEASQRAVCHRRHAIDQQLCRIILLCLDRTQDQELTMTQDLIARTMGVRRESITLATQKLQAAGLIACSRGSITVLNRVGIELLTCECYKIVKTSLTGCFLKKLLHELRSSNFGFFYRASMTEDIRGFRLELTALQQEVSGLKQSYKDLHLNYADTLVALKGLTLHASEAARRAVKSAENAAKASTYCASAAKEAAQASVVTAAEMAADAANASAAAAMEAAAAAAAAAAATALAVAHHAEDASAQASAAAASATQLATEAAAHAVAMSNAAAQYARAARDKQNPSP
jgi:hypothetical protein